MGLYVPVDTSATCMSASQFVTHIHLAPAQLLQQSHGTSSIHHSWVYCLQTASYIQLRTPNTASCRLPEAYWSAASAIHCNALQVYNYCLAMQPRSVQWVS